MKKILILSNHHAYTYNFRKELIQKLLDENYKVYLVLPYGEKVEFMKEMGCEFIDISLDRRGINPIKDIKLIYSYYKIIKNIKPNVVLSYTIKPNIYGGIASKLLKTPYIATVTGLGNALERKGLLQKLIILLYKFSFSNINMIFFQNNSNKRFFEKNRIGVGRHKLVNGSGVNLTEYSYQPYPNETNNIIILYIGRIVKEKGIEELTEAAKIIKKNRENIIFEAVGFYEKDYENKAKELEKLNIIKFYGQQDDVKEYIKNANVIILPSYHEGMANVLLEASSMGRPVIASAIPGCQEIFEEGVTGFGVEPKNVISLVNAINKFIDLPYEKKKEMGISAREKVEKQFDRNKVVSSYMEEIETAIIKE